MAYDNEHQGGGGRLQFGPAPAGFDMAYYDPGARNLEALAANGSCYLLSQTRLDVTGDEQVFSSRLVQRVTGRSGLQSAASFEVAFNPAFETVVIHSFRVWRDGQPREAAQPEAFELLRRELNLERAVYDGCITAHMIIPDVRVGDTIDTAFSIVGRNPVLADNLDLFGTLQWGSPTVETRVTVICHADRRLAIRTFGETPEPEDETVDGVRTLCWRLIDAPPKRRELDEPAWHIGYARVHVTDRLEWSAVADVFRGFYEDAGELPGDLEAAISALPLAASPEAQAATVLAFVQDRLRYHSVGLGAGGFRPRSLEEIWRTRYGDCKDSSRLCVALLRRFGFDASPALVDTAYGFGLPDTQPHLTAFNHCIVRLRLNDATYWLDPTLSAQGETLSALTPQRMGWALPLVADSALEEMKDGPIPVVGEFAETWSFPERADEPVRLEVRNIYRDWRADDIRDWARNDSLADIERSFVERLEKEYGHVAVVRPVSITDDRALNAVVIDIGYELERPLRELENGGLEFRSIDSVVGPNLSIIDSSTRSAPIDLASPRVVMARRVFNFPSPVSITPWDITEEGPGARLHSAFRWVTALQGEQVLRLTVSQRTALAAEARAYFRFVRAALDNNGIRFVMPVTKGRIGTHRPFFTWGRLVWMMTVGAAVAYWIWRLDYQP